MTARKTSGGDAVLDWLLEEENPSVRYYALTQLFGKPASDPDILKAKKAVMKTGVVPRILELRNEHGYWGEPGRFYVNKYGGTVWQLLILAELGADGSDPSIRAACEYLLSASMEREEGGFSTKEGARDRGGVSNWVIPCLTGNMVFALSRLGLGDDPRLKAAVRWICAYQRFDDGTDHPPRSPMYDRFEMCYGRHSCHMGVVKALKGLATVSPEARGKEVKDTIARATEYLLAHRIYRKSHDLEKVSRPGWLRFGFPLMYQTDALEILDILADLGRADPRMDDALDVVEAARGADGRWLLQNSFNGKMLVDVEVKGKPSKWITLRALRVLGAAGRS